MLELNTKGLGCLKAEDMESSLEAFKQAERLLVSALRSGMKKDGTLDLLAVTLNNLACYYKRYLISYARNKCCQIALRYLARVLQIEKISTKGNFQSASTYLNISAILSSIGKHSESLKFAKKANSLFLQQKENSLISLSPSDESQSSKDSFRRNFIISFFNMATELQALGKRRDANTVYAQGYEFAMMDLGPAHPLTKTLKEIMEGIQRDHNDRERYKSNRSTSVSTASEQHRLSGLSGLRPGLNRVNKSRLFSNG